MSGKNRIHYYPEDVRRAIDAALKSGGRTLDELLEQIRADHAERLEQVGKEPPSRSALGRYAKDFEETVREARELREVARGWVGELGEKPDSDTGRMLVELMQSLTAKSLLAAKQKGTMDIEQLWEFARTVNRLSQADALQVRRAQVLKDEARKELIAEQELKLKAATKSGLISAETLATIRKQVYGLD